MNYLIFGQQLNISSEIYEEHPWPKWLWPVLRLCVISHQIALMAT